MENDLENLSQSLKENIVLLKSIIIHELGYNPYKEIDKSLAIITQKNYKYFSSIYEKMKSLTILLYNRRLSDNRILDVLKNIEDILNDSQFDSISEKR